MTIVDIAVRLTGFERRLESVEAAIERMETRLAELDRLKEVVAELRFAAEDKQEA